MTSCIETTNQSTTLNNRNKSINMYMVSVKPSHGNTVSDHHIDRNHQQEHEADHLFDIEPDDMEYLLPDAEPDPKILAVLSDLLPYPNSFQTNKSNSVATTPLSSSAPNLSNVSNSQFHESPRIKYMREPELETKKLSEQSQPPQFKARPTSMADFETLLCEFESRYGTASCTSKATVAAMPTQDRLYVSTTQNFNGRPQLSTDVLVPEAINVSLTPKSKSNIHHMVPQQQQQQLHHRQQQQQQHQQQHQYHHHQQQSPQPQEQQHFDQFQHHHTENDVRSVSQQSTRSSWDASSHQQTPSDPDPAFLTPSRTKSAPPRYITNRRSSSSLTKSTSCRTRPYQTPTPPLLHNDTNSVYYPSSSASNVSRQIFSPPSAAPLNINSQINAPVKPKKRSSISKKKKSLCHTVPDIDSKLSSSSLASSSTQQPTRSKSSKSSPHRYCRICNKLFLCDSKLERHMLSHSGEKPFPCYCGRSFSQKSSLKVHTKKHIEKQIQEGAFKCKNPEHTMVNGFFISELIKVNPTLRRMSSDSVTPYSYHNPFRKNSSDSDSSLPTSPFSPISPTLHRVATTSPMGGLSSPRSSMSPTTALSMLDLTSTFRTSPTLDLTSTFRTSPTYFNCSS